ncbi:hypothetical protein ACGFIR_31530 [Micromonospora sp. NPDC049051]|uniref:hypothetical protein n=1 Tax=Micromonospora sp. NPDC049051 TaxID=3364264 RepID=UPI0037209C5D
MIKKLHESGGGSTSPSPTLPVTGDNTTRLWWLLAIGATMVTVGGTASVLLRRSRTASDG